MRTRPERPTGHRRGRADPQCPALWVGVRGGARIALPLVLTIAPNSPRLVSVCDVMISGARFCTDRYSAHHRYRLHRLLGLDTRNV